MSYGTSNTQGQDSAAQQAHKQAICQAQAGQALLVCHVAQAQGSVPEATPSEQQAFQKDMALGK